MTRNLFFRRRGGKFKAYRIICLISLGLFFISLIAEICLLGDGSMNAVTAPVTLVSFFRLLVTAEVIGFVLIALTGITVYAPAVMVFTALLRGFFSGFILSVVFSGIRDWKSVALAGVTAIYLLLSAYLMLGYAAFCTTVSWRLFSVGLTFDVKEEEKRLFGGVLFNSVLFQNTVNLRFLGTYLLILIAYLTASGALSLIHAAVRCSF